MDEENRLKYVEMEPNTGLFNLSNVLLHENTCRTCLKLLKGDCDKNCMSQQDIKRKIEDLTAVIVTKMKCKFLRNYS